MSQKSQDQLHGVRLKINRARTHLDELKRLGSAFVDRKPFRLVCEEDPDAGRLAYKVRIFEGIPAEMSVIIGDVIHNLRAALDLLATELAVAGGGSGKDAYFPFNVDSAKFKTTWLNKRVPGASPKALRLLKRLKPYPGGNMMLWQLHQLDILDKHKAIVPVGAAYTEFNPDFSAYHPPGGLLDKHRDWFKNVPLFFRPADKQYPLKNDATLLICLIPKPGYRRPEPKFNIVIAFGEGQIVDGEPVVSTLKQLIQLVERITNIAERHLF